MKNVNILTQLTYWRGGGGGGGVRGQSVSAQTVRRTLHQIGLHGCCPGRKPLLKMMHKKACKQFAEDKKTKDMDYWNHVLWSDETKINLFGSDGVLFWLILFFYYLFYLLAVHYDLQTPCRTPVWEILARCNV